MKNFIILIICIFLLFLLYKSSDNGQKDDTPEATVTVHRLKLDTLKLDKSDYSLKDIPDDMFEALKRYEQYKYLFEDNKNFVLYDSGTDCPYLKMFNEYLSEIMAKYKNTYNFYSYVSRGIVYHSYMCEISDNECNEQLKIFEEDDKLLVDFHNNYCHAFCIVNKAQKQVFSFYGVGPKQGRQLLRIFRELENW